MTGTTILGLAINSVKGARNSEAILEGVPTEVAGHQSYVSQFSFFETEAALQSALKAKLGLGFSGSPGSEIAAKLGINLEKTSMSSDGYLLFEATDVRSVHKLTAYRIKTNILGAMNNMRPEKFMSVYGDSCIVEYVTGYRVFFLMRCRRELKEVVREFGAGLSVGVPLVDFQTKVQSKKAELQRFGAVSVSLHCDGVKEYSAPEFEFEGAVKYCETLARRIESGKKDDDPAILSVTGIDLSNLDYASMSFPPAIRTAVGGFLDRVIRVRNLQQNLFSCLFSLSLASSDLLAACENFTKKSRAAPELDDLVARYKVQLLAINKDAENGQEELKRQISDNQFLEFAPGQMARARALLASFNETLQEAGSLIRYIFWGMAIPDAAGSSSISFPPPEYEAPSVQVQEKQRVRLFLRLESTREQETNDSTTYHIRGLEKQLTALSSHPPSAASSDSDYSFSLFPDGVIRRGFQLDFKQKVSGGPYTRRTYKYTVEPVGLPCKLSFFIENDCYPRINLVQMIVVPLDGLEEPLVLVEPAERPRFAQETQTTNQFVLPDSINARFMQSPHGLFAMSQLAIQQGIEGSNQAERQVNKLRYLVEHEKVRLFCSLIEALKITKTPLVQVEFLMLLAILLEEYRKIGTQSEIEQVVAEASSVSSSQSGIIRDDNSEVLSAAANLRLKLNS